MEEVFGLLVTVTEGQKFPKKKVYLSMRYSKYKVSFPVVAGGDTVIFNQGYFFPNVKVPNYNEKTLPILVMAYEKKTFFNDVCMAELKVEASNFAYFDYYEPLEFNLIANEGYASYDFQLKIMFQLVKPTSQFLVPGRADTSNLPPVAYDIEISSASLNESMVNKQLYYSCQLIINDQEDLKTKDIKGVEPQWKLRQIVSAGNFSDPKVMVFQISHVAYPQRRETLKIVGEARLTTKRIKTMNTKHFDISVFHNRTEVGLLHLYVQPLYAQSRDGTADMENVNQLKPNAFISPKKEARTEGEGASVREDAAASPVPIAADSEAGSVAPPQLRKNERALNQGQGNTFRSVSSSQRNTLRSSFTSRGSSIAGMDGPSLEKLDALQDDLNENAASSDVHSHAASPLSPVIERTYSNSMHDATKQPMPSAHSSLNLDRNQSQELAQETSLDQNLDDSLDLDVNMDTANFSMASPSLNMNVDQSPSSNLSPNPSSISSRSIRGEPATAHVEIKKVAVAMVAPVATSEEPMYISQCQAIIRKGQSMYKQGVHLISRPRNDYVENMKFVF